MSMRMLLNPNFLQWQKESTVCMITSPVCFEIEPIQACVAAVKVSFDSVPGAHACVLVVMCEHCSHARGTCLQH